MKTVQNKRNQCQKQHKAAAKTAVKPAVKTRVNKYQTSENSTKQAKPVPKAAQSSSENAPSRAHRSSETSPAARGTGRVPAIIPERSINRRLVYTQSRQHQSRTSRSGGMPKSSPSAISSSNKGRPHSAFFWIAANARQFFRNGSLEFSTCARKTMFGDMS